MWIFCWLGSKPVCCSQNTISAHKYQVWDVNSGMREWIRRERTGYASTNLTVTEPEASALGAWARVPDYSFSLDEIRNVPVVVNPSGIKPRSCPHAAEPANQS